MTKCANYKDAENAEGGGGAAAQGPITIKSKE